MDEFRGISDPLNNSSKRSSLFTKKIKELLPASQHLHLIDICLHPAIVATFKIIQENNDST